MQLDNCNLPDSGLVVAHHGLPLSVVVTPMRQSAPASSSTLKNAGMLWAIFPCSSPIDPLLSKTNRMSTSFEFGRSPPDSSAVGSLGLDETLGSSVDGPVIAFGSTQRSERHTSCPPRHWYSIHGPVSRPGSPVCSPLPPQAIVARIGVSHFIRIGPAP